MDLTGRRALITGASRGIGRAIAESLSAAGADVALLSRTDAKDAIRACKKKGQKAFAVSADVSDTAQLSAAILDASTRLGGLDVLVCAAGVATVGPVHRASEADWRAMVDINLTGAMESVRLSLPHLRSSAHGQIILIGSTASHLTFAGGAAYCATKHGLLGFANALYEETRTVKIKVTTISPGVVDTDMTRDQWAGFDKSQMLRASDVAEAAMYVMACSPRACPQEIILRCHHPSMG